ncbi:MAG: O-antigen ligase family protein [Candidatus Eisenbacteria bacterium]
MARDDQTRVPLLTYPRPRVQSPARHRRIQDLILHPIPWAVFALMLGVFFGYQTTGFVQRYTKLFMGLAFLFVAFRYPLYVGLGLFLVLYPFQTSISLGNTNQILIVLMAVAWMIRAGMGLEARPHRTWLDGAILAYLGAHLLSCVNLTTPEQLSQAAVYLGYMTIPILLYYILVHVCRSERKLLVLSRMFTISILVSYITAFQQRFAPNIPLVPHWYVTGQGAAGYFEGGHRIGGLLTEPLMADVAAIACVHQIYMAARTHAGRYWRILHLLLAACSVYAVSLTGNRGGLVGLVAGLFYFFWIFRKEISWKRAAVVLMVVMGVLTLGESTLGRFEGNVTLLARVAGSYLERGLPDTRRSSWNYVWGRIQQHVILGNGPYYSLESSRFGIRVWWPHNGFLFYLSTIGIVGLSTYLFLLWKVVQRTWAGHGLAINRISLARGLTAVWHIAIVQFILGQLRTDHQRGDIYVIVMWALFGLGVLSRSIWEDEKRSPVRPVVPPRAVPPGTAAPQAP